MRPLDIALVLAFVMSFNEIESSALRRLKTRKKVSSNDDEDARVAPFATSRRQMPTEQDTAWLRNRAPQNNPGQIGQGSNPDVSYFSHPLSIPERLGISFRNGPEINIPERKNKQKIEKNRINVQKGTKYKMESPKVQALYNKYHQPLSERENSPIRSLVLNEEIIPEELKKEFVSMEVFHKHYGFPDDDDGSYRKFLANYFEGSGSGSGK